MTSEAAPQTNQACTAPPPGASLPGATDPSQPRTSTQETGFENLAQLCRSTRLKTSSDGPSRGTRTPRCAVEPAGAEDGGSPE